MRISEAGLDIVREFEGYKRKLPDGGCVAYRCIVGYKNGKPVHDGKWTIGWGCTEGITEGTVWTKKQAEEGLKREIAKAERIVERNVTAEMNQHEFDAFVSFVYNVGEGGYRDPKTGKVTQGFKTSTMLRRFNAGDKQGAAAQFGMWTNSNGVRNVPGLVRRRRMESALFLKPVAEEAVEAVNAQDMPQTIDAPVAAEEHSQAHALLDKASNVYASHGHMIRKTGWATPPALIAAWNWISDPLHAVVLMSGLALAVVVGLEVSRYLQRNKVIGRPA